MELQLTTVQTAPGFCTVRAFTTWNTFTTPSVLHHSMVVAMAQNMPQRLTMSLQRRYLHTHTPLTPMTATVYLQCIMMDRLPVLLWTLATCSITSVTVLRLEQLPSKAQLHGDVELVHLLGTARLWEKNHPLVGLVSSHHMWSPTHSGILNTHSPQHKALQPLLPQELHCELPQPL